MCPACVSVAALANEAEIAKLSPDSAGTLLHEYGEFTEAIVQSGNFKAADRLRPVSTATTAAVAPEPERRLLERRLRELPPDV